jgi:hypothetical protein
MIIFKYYVDWKYVIGRFHDLFEELYGFEQMIEDDVMTLFEVPFRLEQM